MTFNFTRKPQNRNSRARARASHSNLPTQPKPAGWVSPCPLTTCGHISLCRWTQELGTSAFPSPRPLLWRHPFTLPLAPWTLERGREGEGRPGARTAAARGAHPHLRAGLPRSQLCPSPGSGDPQPWPRRSAPAAWPASPHQCQLLTLVASARSSTIQRGSPSPHLAIGFPNSPSPSPEQPQQPPQYRLVASSHSEDLGTAWSLKPGSA